MGGRTIYSNDRYIHRRELPLLSLKSLSSVGHGIKCFLFSLITGIYRGLRSCQVDGVTLFLSTFTVFSNKVFVNFAKIR